MELIKEIEQDFLNIYEADNNADDLLNYSLSLQQALIVLEKGDDVLAKLNDPFALRNSQGIQLHY